ncbi:MAG: response regulator [Planctomycetota bacterium]
MEKDGVILIAEQDEKHFDMMKHSLLRAGVGNKILHLADGSRALEFLLSIPREEERQSENREYILFLDVNLPEVGGVEVLKKIKQDERLSRIPVIVLTAEDDPQTIDRCYDLGCSTYIIKPANDEHFEESIKKIGYFLSSVKIASTK